jgi:hypothetical protein
LLIDFSERSLNGNLRKSPQKVDWGRGRAVSLKQNMRGKTLFEGAWPILDALDFLISFSANVVQEG